MSWIFWLMFGCTGLALLLGLSLLLIGLRDLRHPRDIAQCLTDGLYCMCALTAMMVLSIIVHVIVLLVGVYEIFVMVFA